MPTCTLHAILQFNFNCKHHYCSLLRCLRKLILGVLFICVSCFNCQNWTRLNFLSKSDLSASAQIIFNTFLLHDSVSAIFLLHQHKKVDKLCLKTVECVDGDLIYGQQFKSRHKNKCQLHQGEAMLCSWTELTCSCHYLENKHCSFSVNTLIVSSPSAPTNRFTD